MIRFDGMDQRHIRNFCIIAHIDHGKSTLSDRFLELTGTVEKRKMQQQMLDTMSIERERGITIKMQPVRMSYTLNSESYQLNLIDTPGHVDFSYEVSRSLAAVEGVVLLVDATKGVQAQTLANLEKALAQGLRVIPAVNKIDLKNARVDETKKEISKLLSVSEKDIIAISGKTGQNVGELLEKVIALVPPPSGDAKGPFKALIFDSSYDAYKGVVANVRVIDGAVKTHDVARFMMTGASAEILEVGMFKPHFEQLGALGAGEIGYLATGLKDIQKVRVGDTVTLHAVPAAEPLTGYREPQRVVFASFFPQDADDFDALRDAFLKLKLNDASFYFEPEHSDALGRGFRCGFLGVLHMDIIRERLKREYELVPLITIPSVSYRVHKRDGTEYTIFSAIQIGEQAQIAGMSEPFVKLEILTDAAYVGAVMRLCEESRGVYQGTDYVTPEKALLRYEAPLAEIIVDFYDRLKSATSGYASLNYELSGYAQGDLVKMDILVAGEQVESLSQIVPRAEAERKGRALVTKLKEVLPRQLFAVSVQAALGGKIIAREDIPAMRKDVTGYLYGGDYTRKRKLLEKQKKGKQRMKASGRVHIPPDVYFKIMQKQ